MDGRRLRGRGMGGSLQRKWGGGRPTHPCPNISRSTVIGCEAKYELTKKVLRMNFGLWNWTIWWRKEAVTWLFYVKFKTGRQERRQTNTVNDWKGHQERSSEIFGTSFLKRGRLESWSEKCCPPPQTRCQVSAHTSMPRSPWQCLTNANTPCKSIITQERILCFEY